RNLLVVSDESVREAAKDWPKLVWIVDAQREDKLVPISTCPLPPVKKFAGRGGRFGAHNLHENRPGGFISEDVVVGTFFNGDGCARRLRQADARRRVAHRGGGPRDGRGRPDQRAVRRAGGAAPPLRHGDADPAGAPADQGDLSPPRGGARARDGRTRPGRAGGAGRSLPAARPR